MRFLQLTAVSVLALAVAPTTFGQCRAQTLEVPIQAFGHFGTDLSHSGTRALVGAELEQAAYLFERSGGNWQPTHRLRSPDPTSVRFGQVVAISGDTALVSDFLHPSGGRVFVFERAGATWVHTATLTPSDGYVGDYFGVVMALDGDRAAMHSISETGSVYVFERAGGAWQEVAKVSRPFSFFGQAMALEGDTLFVGAGGDSDKGSVAGACHVFERQAGTWVETAKLYAAKPFPDAMFGQAIDLEGPTAVIGAPAYFNPDRRGRAYVFEEGASGWSQTQSLRTSGSTLESAAGGTVSIAGDRILLADFGDEAADRPGGVWVFERNGSEWSQTAKLRRPRSDEGYDDFGRAVVQLDDQVLVGSTREGSGNETGVCHVFDMTLNVPASFCQSTVNSTGQPALISAIGSHEAGANDVILRAAPVPDGPGYFSIGGQTQQVPFWDGFLCVAAPFSRFSPRNAKGNELVQRVDLTSLRFPVLAGSTWHFQAWFADPQAGGSGANTSDGVSVTFCP